MSELKEKAIKAAEKFLERRGYEVVESNWKSEGGNSLDLVAREDDTVVFVDVYARHGFDKGMPEEGSEGSRERREIAAAAWLSEHADDEGYVDMPVRFDSIAMMLLSENRALLKHHINCLGCGLTSGQADLDLRA